MDKKTTILPIDSTTFEVQKYKTSDLDLIIKSELDTSFSSITDYIEYYVYDENQTLIYPLDSNSSLNNFNIKQGDVLLNPENDLETLGFDIGKYLITYNFYRKQLGSSPQENFYIKEISSDRTEIRLGSNVIENSLIISSTEQFINYRETQNYFVDFLLNFGNNKNIIANNIVLDDENIDEPTILIKLYEPLPEEFDLKTPLWVVESISNPQSYQVDFPFIPIIEDNFTLISGPNFNLNVTQETGNSSQNLSYSNLISSNITSSVNQIKNLLSKKEININVNYENFNEFIHFSTALTRLENFYYKVGLIETYTNELNTISSSISNDTVNTIAYSSSLNILNSQIDKIIHNFDGYEYFMYFNSGSDYSYPKSNNEPPFNLFPTGSPEVINWLGSADENNEDYGGVALSASLYDEENLDQLYKSIPEYLREDPDNYKYELFVDMVAQHYDNIWLYTKDITNKFNADNRLDYGISKDLIAEAIKDFGVKLYSNNFNNTDLYLSFLGISPSGSLFPFSEMTGSLPTPSGYEYVDTQISSSSNVVPLNDITKRIYKRIYHNLPYLLKTKGTIQGLRTLINSYGIPDTILRINEFGNKNRNTPTDWDFKQNTFNYSFDTGETSTNYVSSSLTPNPLFSNSNPQTIQLRFKTPGIPLPTNNVINSNIRYSQSLWSTNDGGNLVLEYTGSGFITESYSGSISNPYDEYGTLKWIPAQPDNPSISASVYLPFFNKDWWSVQININGSNTTLYTANKIENVIGFQTKDTITIPDASYYFDSSVAYLNKDSNIVFDDGTVYTPFSGSFQEYRLWSTELSQSAFYDFVLNPYSIKGNEVNSTSETLIFRADLGTQLNTSSRTSIHPKVTGSQSYVTESFSGGSSFYINDENWVINREDIYLNQPSSGIKNRITEKVKLKDNNLPEPILYSNSSSIVLSSLKPLQQVSRVDPSYISNTNYLEVAFSPADQINDDINAQFGYFNLGEYIGDPRHMSSPSYNYPDLNTLRDSYFEKYIKGYDVVDFVRLMKFFDNSLFKMIKDFTPARTSLSSGIVVKQHILERNRQRPAQASWSNETYSGSIKPQSRNYNTGSGDVGQYESTDGSSIYKFDGGTGGSFERYNGLQSYPESLDNRFNLTQSYSESIEGSVANTINNSGSFVGYGEKIISDQHEFYDGEFSGSNIIVTTQSLNPGCDPYLRINDTSIFFNPLFFNSTPGTSTYGTVSTTEFLKSNNVPVLGDAWILSEGTGGGSGKVIYIKLSSFDIGGSFIGNYLNNSKILTLKLPEGNGSVEYHIDGVKSFSDHIALTIKPDVGDFNIISSSNGGSENWSLTASGNFKIGGENSDSDDESQGRFRNNYVVSQSQQFWYYNGSNVGDPLSFFNIGDQNKPLSDLISNPNYYGSGSYNPQRTSNINWYVSCSIDYSALTLDEIIKSGDLYKGYSYEGTPLTDQNFTLDSFALITSDSFYPSPYSEDLPDDGAFKLDYDTQIPGNSGSEAGEIGGNIKINVPGTASFKYLAGTDSALKFNISQIPQTAPLINPTYSPISGSALYDNGGTDINGDFTGSFTNSNYGFFAENGSISPDTPTIPLIYINIGALSSAFKTKWGYNPPSNANYNFELYDGTISSSLSVGTELEFSLFYSSSSGPNSRPTNISEFTGSLSGDILTHDYPNSDGISFAVDFNQEDFGAGDGTGYLYLIPLFKVNNDLGDYVDYKFLNFSCSAVVNDGSKQTEVTIATDISQSASGRTGGWNKFDITSGGTPTNPTVKAKWELRVTSSNGDDVSLYEQTSDNPTIILSGSDPIYVNFDTVDWGTISDHENEEDDMYYLKYTLYDYVGGTNGGAESTDFEFLSIDNTGDFDTLQISQSIELRPEDWDLTGSLRIYRGTPDNPRGEIIKSDDFIVPTPTTDGTFILNGKLYEDSTANFKPDDTYRMGVYVTKSLLSGLDITSYTMSIFPSSSIYAPLPGPPAYDNYKEPTSSAFFIPTYFGDGVLPFEYALDCQPLLNNYIDARQSSFIMDIDYTTESGSIIPVNQAQILSGSAVKATVQDSNYTTIAHTSLRYEGSKASSQYLNVWSPKDIGTYGKTPVVESRDAYFGYFNNISNPYPLLNDKTKVNLNYLIDQEGNALPPSLDDTIAKDIFEKTFPKEGLARISVSSGSNDLQSLNQLNSIYKIGQYPVPIMYTQTSSRGYANSVPITGSGRISMYDNPNNPNSFTDYSFTAVGTSSLGNGSTGGTEISTILNPTETTSSKAYANGWANGNLPYTSEGIITFNSESFVSAGSNTSQQHYIDLETSIPTTYIYDSDYNRNGSFWRKHKHVEKLELTLKLGLLYIEDGGSAYNNIPFNFEDIGLKVWKNDGTYSDLGSISDKVKYVQKIPSTKTVGRGRNRKTTTIYKYSGGSEIGLNSSNQAEIQIDNDVVVDILKSKGFGNVKGTQTGGDIAGLEWTLKANSGDNLYLSGSSLQWELSGSILNTNGEGGNNTFIPDSYPGPKNPVSITLQGSKSHLLAGDNTGSAPFWVFGSELTTPISKSISGSNILFMSSSNINEAYGDSYKQGTLDYTPGVSELFPGGEEPTDTSIGDVYSTIKLEIGDEIRFGNNENYSYKIVKVTPPSQNIMGDGIGRLKIELDKSLPYQVPASGQSVETLNKDFFLIRRYIDNINTLYLDVPFPYGTLPTGSNSPGILYPDFPTKYLQNSASVIINDLISKGIIT